MPLRERDEGAAAPDVVYQHYSASAMMDAACSVSNSVFLVAWRLSWINNCRLPPADFRDQWRKATPALTRDIRPAGVA
jgi:hypothetical protein